MATTERELKSELLGLGEWKRTIPAHIRERFEVIDGRLMEKDMAMPPHGRLILQLYAVLARQAPGLDLSTDVITFLPDRETGGEQECHPDLAGVHCGNPVPFGADAYRGVPDLVVEVASRSTQAWDRTRKAAIYAEAGVPHYWLADPFARTVEALRLNRSTGEYEHTWERLLDAVEVPDDLK